MKLETRIDRRSALLGVMTITLVLVTSLFINLRCDPPEPIPNRQPSAHLAVTERTHTAATKERGPDRPQVQAQPGPSWEFRPELDDDQKPMPPETEPKRGGPPVHREIRDNRPLKSAAKISEPEDRLDSNRPNANAIEETSDEDSPGLGAEVRAETPAIPETDAWDADNDDTPDVETETTVSKELREKGWMVTGDVRPILDVLHESSREGTVQADAAPGVRARVGADYGINEWLSIGARIAGSGFIGQFNPYFILPGENPESSELEPSTYGIDQLYLRWRRRDHFSLAIGRIQTRFQLRGGVYAKSLDRNNSHNIRVNWTDGLQTTFMTGNWTTSFVLEVNPRSGPSGVRRDPLDFDDSGAGLTYFLGLENVETRGLLVQRALDLNYLPQSLLKDADPDRRRTDYWGAVGRLAIVWPPDKRGPRLRAGAEVGYAPETPTHQAVDLDGEGDVSGLAWNVVVSVMDFTPRQSIGLNYARTGAGWLLSPQYRPNHELVEIRHVWRTKHSYLVETRIRRRTELAQRTDAVQRRSQWDFYIRATVPFTLFEQ